MKLNLKLSEDQIKVNQLKEIQELLLEKLKKPKKKQDVADIYLNYIYNFLFINTIKSGYFLIKQFIFNFLTYFC
jgi:hypothetical protein